MKFCHFVIIAILTILCFSVTNVEALTTTNFDITANYVWGNDIGLRTSVKQNTSKYTAVIWKTSNKSSHKMWFRVIRPSDEKEMGKGIFDYVDSDAFTTNLTQGQSYMLQARREFILDPAAQVTGYWAA